MTNEITTKNLDFAVEFKQSEITVANKEQFETAVKAYAEKYAGLIVDPDNLQDAKDVRAEMNKINKGMDEKRKEIKREFNKPLTEFEDWIKNQKNEIQNVITPIDEGIKTFEELEQKARYEKMMVEVAEMAPNYGVTVEEITINPSWANKGYFTTKGHLNKKGLDEIAGEMNYVKKEKDQLETNKTLIANYAKAVELEPESWVLQIENGATPQELMKQIDQAIKAKAERLEIEKKNQEYEQAIAGLETKPIEVGNKTIDEDTGEILADLPFGDDADPFPFKKPVIQTETYRMSAPNSVLIQVRQHALGLGVKIEKINE